jgi:hypothetical protein
MAGSAMSLAKAGLPGDGVDEDACSGIVIFLNRYSPHSQPEVRFIAR